MARTTIAKEPGAADISSGALELTTEATFETMTPGTNNGVMFPFSSNDVVILRNTTGGDATYTLLVNPPDSVIAVGGSVTDPEIVVANNEEYIFRPPSILKQDDGMVYIDVDVAAEIIVIA